MYLALDGPGGAFNAPGPDGEVNGFPALPPSTGRSAALISGEGRWGAPAGGAG